MLTSFSQAEKSFSAVKTLNSERVKARLAGIRLRKAEAKAVEAALSKKKDDKE